MLPPTLQVTLVVLCFTKPSFSRNYTGNEGEPQHFKLGLLAPWKGTFRDFSALTSASAVSIAIERVHSDPTLGSKMRFSVVTKDSGCSSKTAAGNAVRLFIEDNVDVFLGPACSVACRPAAELASYWNKPIVSWVASDPDFNDKNIYSTLGRTLGPFNKMAVFTLEVYKQYGWRRVVIVSANYFLWLDAGKAFRRVFKDDNVTISYDTQFDRNPPDHYIKRVLNKITEEGRIVMLLVPKEDRRRFMLMAHDLGMTKGDYVFYTIEMLPEENVLNPEDVWAGNDGRDKEAKQAFEAVFHVTLAALANAEVQLFRKEVARRMRMPPWDEFVPKNLDNMDSEMSSGSGSAANYVMGDKYSPFLYDAVMLYAVALNETMAAGDDYRSGVVVRNFMRGKTFKGMTGNVVLDDYGDREPDYWITDMAPNGTFIKIAEVLNTDKGERIFSKNVSPPRWPGGKVGQKYAPPDVPACGFRNEFCQEERVAGWILAVAVILALMAIGTALGLGVYFYRRRKYESDLLVQSWKVQYEDIEPVHGGGASKGKVGSTPTISSGHQSMRSKDLSDTKGAADPSKSSQSRSMPSVGTGQGQIFSDIGLYKAVVVAMKHIKKEHITLTRQVMIEFNEMKDIVHENLNVFVGASIDPPNICLVWHYCSKGSLQDVLENDDIKLDNTFKFSFMTDLCKGMQYLHSTHIMSHGNLKSSNCLIDSRWTLKITDYGLPSFLTGQENQQNEMDVFKTKLWTAPEILRENFPPPRGTQKSDVYSFAVICFEIMMRTQPYSFENITPRDVVNRVRNGESIPYRPPLPESSELGKPLLGMIKSCWDEVTESRPTFLQIRATLRKMTRGEINIMDNILKIMEKYAYNLEEIVDERTTQLVEEKKKTDRLLYRMLPSTVADQLKAGRFVKPEDYDQATIYFSDIVGFTMIASESSPMQIVDFLNDLYSCFDDIIATHDVYKVETIGDAYMIVSGVPVRNGQRHPAEMANCALALLSAVTNFRVRDRPNEQLQLRIGIHTGPVVAGVVGTIMPRYCMFGDTVNMAARMESSGKPLRIHISKTSYIALTELQAGYQMTLRGEMNVKGKGIQMTYWLYGKNGFDKPLPAFDNSKIKEEDAHDGKKEVPVRQAMMQSYDCFQETDTASGLPEVV